ncbi:MAG: cell division ATP-binding protein FtsE [delta proteobacterium ML8_F1]|nr:MAG: cell division ATP-binding protein FtsE [delta proteobacterium ML8_F1]
MITLNEVTKQYSGGSLALDNINLHIQKGEFVFIVGQSGAGKSTFVKLILKEENPTKGKVVIDGIDLGQLHRRRVPYLRRRMGVVFQDFRLLPKKTVYENVAYSMEIIGARPKEVRKRVPLILSMVGLSQCTKKYPEQLSGGEQQRVSIARAMINNPPLLIADEPTGNLDPDTSWEIMRLLKQFNGNGTTVVMATHDQNIVDAMKMRVVKLENGRIVRDESMGGY